MAPFSGSVEGLAINATATAFMLGGYGDNEEFGKRVWLLHEDRNGTYPDEQPCSCSLRMYPDLALQGTLYVTRAITLHGTSLLYTCFFFGSRFYII